MSVIDWALYSERAVGRGSLSYTDVINRPLREVMTISGQDPDASFPGFSLVGHTHDASAVVSGTLAPARGGTGLSSPTAGGLLVAAAAAAMTLLAPGASGQVVKSNGTGWAAAAIVSADISDAASINTPSRIVIRDASGNFVAGTITAALAGNASTASALATPRAINGVNFDGSAPITVKASTTNALTIGTHLTGSSFDGSSPITIATDATAANTVGTIVARDGSGNFAAGVITASFTGALTGNASTATKFAAAVNINGVAFDGSAPITVPAAAATLTGTTLAANVVTSSLTGVGILTAGTWQATIVAPAFGGTGVANANTITLGGNINTASAFTTVGGGLTLTVTGATNVTLPTSGTLVNTAVTTLTSLSLVNGQTISSAASFTGSVAVATGLTVGGSADLQGGVKVSGGTFAAGHSLFVSATTGLNVVGHVTGGSPTADFTLVNNQGLGQTVMDVPTGTVNVRLYGALTVASTAVFNGSLTSNAGFFGTTGSFNSGLTVSAGTTAVQALTATTGAFTGNISFAGITGAGRIVGGSTGISVRDVTNSADNFLVSDIGNVTIRGSLSFIGVVGQAALIGGSTGFKITNNAVSADNLSMTDAGVLTIRGGLTVSAGTTAVQALTATTVTATGNITAGTTAGFFWSGRSRLISNSDGQVSVQSNAGAAAEIVVGAVTASGDLSVNTSKFTVAAASGNTVVAGSVTVAGTAVFNGSLTSNAGLFGTTGSFNSTLAVAGTLTVTGGSLIAGGDLFVTGTNGLFVVGKTGSSTDLVLANGLGGTVIDVPTGKTVARFAASAAANASARFPHGAAPTSPVDGDFWTTTAGAFIRINGVTKTFTLT